MAFVLIDELSAGQPNLVAPNNYQINRVGLTDNRESLALTPDFLSFDRDTAVTGPSLPFPGSATNARIMDTQHTDYHYRFWVIPDVLNLTNPLLGTNIPFQLWNTFPDDETLQSIAGSGTGFGDLAFDLVPLTTTIGEFAFETFNVQIGEQASTVDADVLFNFESGSALLEVLATIANTFNLIPDVPVNETWEFNTDVITSFSGAQQRISLRTDPRTTLDFSVYIEDEAARRLQYQLLLNTIDTITTMPAYAHATEVTQAAPIGATRIFFDASRTQMRQGENLAIIDATTEEAQVFEIQTLFSDGALLNGSLGSPITARDFVYPAHAMIIRNRSGLTMEHISGNLRLRAEGFAQPALPRPGATVAIEALNGYNIMTRRPLPDASELINSRRQILDFDTGIKAILRQGDPHATFQGARQWSIKRYENPEDEDFMRQFIADARGGQRAWLLPTWLEDLTLVEAPLPNASQILVNELSYASLQVSDTWARIQIEYETLEPSQHLVTLTEVVNQDQLQLSISPTLPSDPAASNIRKISFLLKVVGGDTIRRSHGALNTIYSWAFETTDFG